MSVGELAVQVRGVTYKKADASSEPRLGTVGVVRAGNIKDGELALDDLVYVPAELASDKQRLRVGDVLVATSSGSLDVVGKAARVRSDATVAFGAFCKVLRPEPDVDPGYFAHYFMTRRYRSYVSRVAAGANINNLKKADLDDIEIPLPPIEEQRRIAAVLDAADALRAKRREALAKLDSLTQAIFVDMFGDLSQHDTVPFLTLLKRPLRNGISPSKSGEVRGMVLTLGAVTGGGFDPAAVKESTFAAPHSREKLVDQDDFLLCRGNGNLTLVGRGRFPTQPMTEVAFPDTIIAARVNTDLVDPRFLEHVWTLDVMRGQIESAARTTNGTHKVNQTSVGQLEVPVPPLESQRRFAAARDGLARHKNVLRLQAQQFDGLFTSLQQRAFRGEL